MTKVQDGGLIAGVPIDAPRRSVRDSNRAPVNTEASAKHFPEHIRFMPDETPLTVSDGIKLLAKLQKSLEDDTRQYAARVFDAINLASQYCYRMTLTPNGKPGVIAEKIVKSGLFSSSFVWVEETGQMQDRVTFGVSGSLKVSGYSVTFRDYAVNAANVTRLAEMYRAMYVLKNNVMGKNGEHASAEYFAQLAVTVKAAGFEFTADTPRQMALAAGDGRLNLKRFQEDLQRLVNLEDKATADTTGITESVKAQENAKRLRAKAAASLAPALTKEQRDNASAVRAANTLSKAYDAVADHVMGQVLALAGDAPHGEFSADDLRELLEAHVLKLLTPDTSHDADGNALPTRTVDTLTEADFQDFSAGYYDANEKRPMSKGEWFTALTSSADPA